MRFVIIDGMNIDKIVQQSIDSKARDSFDTRFVSYVLAVSNHRVDRDVQGVGYFLIDHPFCYTDEDFFFTRRRSEIRQFYLMDLKG